MSRARGKAFYLFTQPKQLLADSIDEATHGLSGLVEAEGEDVLWKLGDKHLSDIKPDEESHADLIRRLKALSKPANDFPEYRLRQNLAAVEALLYGELAVNWRVANALPELRRLALRSQAARLEILTTEDPTEQLREALLSGDLRHWALKFAMKEKSGKYIDLIVDAIPLQSPHVVGTSFDALKNVNLSPDQIRRLARYHAGATSPEASVAAATFLLHREGGDAHYEELRTVALRKHTLPQFGDLEGRAREALLAYSIKTGKRREDSAAIARSFLKLMPADSDEYFFGLDSGLQALGELGCPDDVALLSEYYRPDDLNIANIVIEAVARIDPKAALPLVHRNIAGYLAKLEEPSFDEAIGTHLDLLFWQRDTECCDDLAAAIIKYRDREPDDDDWHAHNEQILKYFRATTLGERVAAAREYVAAGGLTDKKWRDDVRKQLVAEGADPDAVARIVDQSPKADK